MRQHRVLGLAEQGTSGELGFGGSDSTCGFWSEVVLASPRKLALLPCETRTTSLAGQTIGQALQEMARLDRFIQVGTDDRHGGQRYIYPAP